MSPRRATSRVPTIVAVAVVAAVVVPTVAALALTRDDGAATPAEAARMLAEAVESRDAHALYAALPPGERDVLAPAVATALPELQRLGLVAGFDGGVLSGAEVRFDDLELRTEMLDDLYGEVAAVDVVGGTVSGAVDPAATPLTERGAELLRSAFGVAVDDAGQFRRDFSQQPLHLVAVHEGGGWHVSLLYSIADAVRTRHDLPFPKIGEGPLAAGSATPEQAAHELLETWADSEAARAVALMNPTEMRSLYDYAPLFLLPSQRAGRLADDEGSYDAQLNAVTFRFEGAGGIRRARIVSLDADLRDGVTKTHINVDGRCFRQDERFGDDDGPFSSSVACANDVRGRQISATRPRTNPFSVLAVFGGGAELPTLTVVERNGRWFVDPLRSIVDSLTDTLREIEPGDLEDLARGLDASIEATARWAVGEDAEPEVAAAARRITDRQVDAATVAQREVAEACTRAVLAHDPTVERLDARQQASWTRCAQLQVQRHRVESMPSIHDAR